MSVPLPQSTTKAACWTPVRTAWRCSRCTSDCLVTSSASSRQPNWPAMSESLPTGTGARRVSRPCRSEGPPLVVLERLLRQRVIGGEDQRAAGAFLLQLLLLQLRSRCCVLDMDARDAAPARADRSDGGRVALA